MNLEAAREQMIEQQVHAWEVFDERVLTAMRAVPRERFVPAAYRNAAFADAPIPLGHRQWMLPATIHGRILQTLEIQPTDAVLEIGTGSGYLTACLGRLAAGVRSLDIFSDFTTLSRTRLLAAVINNVALETADAMRLEETGNYDVIAVTGSLPIYDERFQRALKLGGRLFVVVGVAPAMEAWKVTRTGEREWQRVSVFETIIDPLINAPCPSGFIF